MRKSVHVSPRRSRAWALAALGCTALTAPLAITPALAQSAEEAEVDENTIIVTAQRRAEALEDVPMTVNVLTAETLASTGVNSIRDLANVTSGYSLGNGGSVPQPAIRGITSLINGGYENNVAVYVDGVYQVVPTVLNLDLPDVSNVQVLKGPQGTLYGRNATGGALLLETIQPGDTWRGKAEFTYARFDDRRASAQISGPITEGVGISLSGYMRRTDGYYKRLSHTTRGAFEGHTFGLTQDSFRAKIKADLTESFSATIGYSYLRSDDPRGVHFSPIENVPAGLYGQPGGTFNGQLLLPQKLGETAYDFDPKIEAKQHEGFVKLELDTGIGQLRSLTAYQHTEVETNYDFEGSYLPGFYGTGSDLDKTIQETVDFNIDAIEGLNLLIGGEYYSIKRSNVDGIPTRTIQGRAFNPLAPAYTYTGVEVPAGLYIIGSDNFFDRKKEAWAVYADATVNLTDQLSVNVGGRYSKEKQHVRATGYGIGGVGVGPINFSPTTGLVPTDRRSSYSKFTPRASIRYEITPTTSIYASFSKGFKSGEWNTNPGATPNLWSDVNQETIEAFEAGIKSSGRRLRFDISGFHYDYTDLQVSLTTLVNGLTQTLLQNAPSAKIYGAEANVEYEVVDNLTLRAGATWLHARYGDGFIFTGVGVNPAVTGLSTNPDPIKNLVNVTRNQDLSGMQMARAPDFSAYGGIDYLIPNEDGGLRFAVNAKYTDSYVVTNPSIYGGEPTNDPTPGVNNTAGLAGTPFAGRAEQQRYRQGRYVLVNASVTWTDPTDSYYLRLWGNNLTDKRYRQHYTGNSTIGTYAPLAEPLTFGATVGFKFREDDAPPPPAPTPPPPAPPPVAVAPPQVVCNKGPYIVFFDWDKSDITPEAATILDSAVGAYANCDSVPIMLAGYTDRSGSAKYNQGLSERRNTSVRGYLTGRGIPDGSITSQAFGESNPRVPTADGVRELQNRRVEITYGPGSGM